MKPKTISQITASFGLTTRTLRYYEQVGLLKSTRIQGYAYRAYDEEAVDRLSKILVLRKLRIPLKQIITILDSRETAPVIDAFEENINRVNQEIGALSTIRDVLEAFIQKLEHSAHLTVQSGLLQDMDLLALTLPLAIAKTHLKEDPGMSDLNQASEKLDKLTDRDVRIVYLPPATVAAYQFEGDEPEMTVHKVIDGFARDSGLVKIKPDVRHYGFNNPNPVDETNHHGYEDWVTIPDDMDVPAPIVKKQFPGGLYAAYAIPMGDFHMWDKLIGWANESNKYEILWGDPVCMYGLMEEHLNYANHVHLENTEPDDLQLDLLLPIREK